MNICLVSRELYPFQKAGIGVYIHNLTKLLVEHNHRVIIITSKENANAYNKKSKQSNISVHGVDVEEGSTLFEDFNYAYSYSAYLKLKQVHEDNPIDLVEFADYFGESFFSIIYKNARNEFKNIPFVIKLHAPTYECNVANQLDTVENSITRQEDFAIKNVEYLYAISNFMKDTISKRLGRLDIEVVYNMIELPSDCIAQNNISDIIENKFVLFVGRLEVLKGIDIFVRAAVKFLQLNKANFKFVIIGRNVVNVISNRMIKDELLEIIPNELQKFFIWIDPLSLEELVWFYKHAYVSVFPSRFEGFGNVCVEAMTMGSPVIVSDKTALQEVIDNGSYGLSFANGDADDLYSKLTYIINDENYRNELSVLSQERAQSFALFAIYSKQINFYKSIIEHHYKKDKKQRNINILEQLLLTNIERTYHFSHEIKRLAGEWDKLKEMNETYAENISELNGENSRLILEWDKMKEINETYAENISKLTGENSRLILEWDSNKNYIKQLKNEIEILQNEINDSNNEANRILNEWKFIVSEHNHLKVEHENALSQKNSKLEELKIQLQSEKEQLFQKDAELKSLKELLESKKSLVKLLFANKKGTKLK
ncbi:glycosyltransferase family 4 protein [Paenibacillus hexagrammi]|uniref:Glycosyltransferase n=1 Tax=Paenibacillus hexagrammi TaxID=2908839 RepID=A0ABY3SM48_9BACL|nr:glycosyltransferase family 4 protein [Paenibacillus sp. YPD9-1]UJF34266.1 glycosyltransferase [Paenibacillus sp. YPD9-1]